MLIEDIINEDKKYHYYNLDRGVYRLQKDNNGKIIGKMYDRQKEIQAGFPNADEVLSNTKQAAAKVAKLNEDLRAWFGKGKKGGAGGGGWDRYNTKGERIGKCGDRKPGEGKPKCLSKSRAASLRAKGGKEAIAKAVNRKRRKDPNKNRKGKAKNVKN